VSEWSELWHLALALALSSSIGLEREIRQKSAGLRTYSLVGLGSALFMMISKADIAVERPDEAGSPVSVLLEIHGTSPVAGLAAKIGDVPGVHEVYAGDANAMFD